MSEKNGIKVFIVHGKGTKARLKARLEAIRSGKELLPDGSRYPEKPKGYDVKLFWEELKESERIKIPKAYLDSRCGSKEETQRQLTLSFYDDFLKAETKKEIKFFIEHGGEGVDLSFEEERLIFGIMKINTKEGYSGIIEITKGELYDSQGYPRDKRGSISGYQRAKIDNMLMKLTKTSFPMWRYVKVGKDKRGQPVWRPEKTFYPLIRTIWIYRNIKNNELKEYNRNPKRHPKDEQFDHYQILINPILAVSVDEYFRLGMADIPKEISEYRTSKNQIASKYDLRFYSLLLNENREEIRRNYLKIAQAPLLMQDQIDQKRFARIRQIQLKIYKMYKDLGYLLDFKTDQPGTKLRQDIFYLNPEKFHRLRKKRLEK